MSYDMHGPASRMLPTILAGGLLFLAGCVSVSGMSVFGQYFGFGFIPLLILAVWPRRAKTLLSVIIVFLVGLFTDWGTGGVIGQYALIFTVIWGVTRPELRNSPYAIVTQIFVWLAICAIAALLLSTTGWFVFGVLPDFASLGRQAILATILFPLVIVLRHWVATRLGENEVWGG